MPLALSSNELARIGPSKLRVFVSSTSEDLRDYRAVARLVILDMGWYPEMMEHFGAMPKATVAACHEKLKQCDLLLLIVGFRRGWVPTPEQGGSGQDSITALELAYARELGIPILALLASETWPGNLWEDDAAARAWIKKFRDEINLPAQIFDYEVPTAAGSQSFPAFRALLRGTLVSHQERILSKEATPERTDPLSQLESARATLGSGRCIPFIGHGVYGEGPLSTTAIIHALGQVHEASLATVAEYRERFLRGRENLLTRLEEIIREQAKEAAVPSVYELLVTMRPPLIVSATYDLMLEQLLEERAKQKIWIVCHVIHSLGGADSGKVLVFHGLDDKTPELSLADKVNPRSTRETYIVYKPLGSPLLNRRLDPDLGIDTVVVTERDHLALLARLEHQSTGLPTAFCRYLQRYPLVFLGYTMDVWHYRLVLSVLQSIGQPGQPPVGLAVRQPTSEVEGSAWRRLGVELLPMDLESFTARIGLLSAAQP
jgi:Domain of unknown function (DUF4062)/SIR2-like domain